MSIFSFFGRGIGGAAAAALVATAVAWVIGFGPTGITAGSLATSIMATYGGAVPSGSFCAIMQSIGTGALLRAKSIIIFLIGAAAAGAASAI
ncbi:hypothetical protein BC939DRAFT_451976 [Gamsiella multidivaricata]|uniref:uncharacterized protein n=1 Tax=Gamsiella multidivaricata TaxID=101098 RepID=UPI00221FEF64|nr:uncharacterized protein BC939DRAFT_451976 [Gamsiella multidivaricata]KAI7823393.1 hypothetical protein BC939DRAFT_451976 [Gamsiella multidivaricata]